MISKHVQRIEFMQTLLTAIDPDHVLARGYSITSREGKTITQAEQLQQGMIIQTTFLDGNVKSKVE